MDTLKTILIIGAVIGFIACMIYLLVEDENHFKEQVENQYKACIAAHESEWTCKAYVNSVYAKRSADNAAMFAAGAAGAVAANSGKR